MLARWGMCGAGMLIWRMNASRYKDAQLIRQRRTLSQRQHRASVMSTYHSASVGRYVYNLLLALGEMDQPHSFVGCIIQR